MKNSYEQNSPCTFAEQLTAYLYDEIAGVEKDSFESHLQNCRVCINELADFGALRSSIANWRENEFSPLPTPIIVLPASSEIFEGKRSWFATFQEFFSFSPARAVFASVLALLVFAGLFWIGSNSLRHEELADLSNVEKVSAEEEKAQIENKTALLPTPLPNRQNENVVRTPESLAKSPTEPKTSSTANKNSGGRNVVLVTNNATPITVNQKTLTKSSTPKPNVKAPVKPSRRNDVEVLDEDDEDNQTLRLSDIFSEIGMNDSKGKKESK